MCPRTKNEDILLELKFQNIVNLTLQSTFHEVINGDFIWRFFYNMSPRIQMPVYIEPGHSGYIIRSGLVTEITTY